MPERRQEYPDQERTENGLESQELGDQASDQRRHDRHRQRGGQIRTAVQHPAHDAIEKPPPCGDHEDNEEDEAPERLAEQCEVESILGDPRERRQQQPPDRVHGHARSEGYLSEVPPEQPHVLEDLGDHRECRHRQGESEEPDEDRSFGRTPDERIGHQESRRGGHCQGHQQGTCRHTESGSPKARDDAEVGLVADDDQEEYHPDPRKREDHRLDDLLAEDPLGGTRKQLSEHRRAQQHTCQQLPDHGRLAHGLHDPAQQPRKTDEQRQLHEEHENLVLAQGRVESRALEGQEHGGDDTQIENLTTITSPSRTT